MDQIKVKFYERHEDDVAVYSRKEYDYFCRFPNVKEGMPVVVESAFGLGLAKVTAIGVEGKATKHVVGFVVTEVETPKTAEEHGAEVLEVERKISMPSPPPPKLSPPGLKPPTPKATPIEEDEIPY